jgi:hypothetical protein
MSPRHQKLITFGGAVYLRNPEDKWISELQRAPQNTYLNYQAHPTQSCGLGTRLQGVFAVDEG